MSSYPRRGKLPSELPAPSRLLLAASAALILAALSASSAARSQETCAGGAPQPPSLPANAVVIDEDTTETTVGEPFTISLGPLAHDLRELIPGWDETILQLVSQELVQYVGS